MSAVRSLSDIVCTKTESKGESLEEQEEFEKGQVVCTRLIKNGLFPSIDVTKNPCGNHNSRP
jgi:hypothetical protein